MRLSINLQLVSVKSATKDSVIAFNFRNFIVMSPFNFTLFNYNIYYYKNGSQKYQTCKSCNRNLLFSAAFYFKIVKRTTDAVEQ